jgi:AraC-like DNA-binding protein
MAIGHFYVFLYVGLSSSARRARARAILVDQVRGKLETLCEAIIRSRGDLCAADAARLLRMQPDDLPRWLRETTHTNYRQFRSRVKIRMAAHLLIRTRAPIWKIGLVCGFRDRSSFDRMFLRQTRVSPAAYRCAFRFRL